MAPCSRARCRHCGTNVGIFGLKGFGWSLRLHEARCAATSAATNNETATVETTTREPMLAAGLVEAAKTLALCVDVAVDVTDLDEDLVKFLHVPKDELKKLCEADIETANEVMLLGLFTWRPGSSDAGPLCLALGIGPGDPGEIVVKARPGSLELLSNELPPEEHMDTNSMVNFNEDFRDIAVRRCTKLQRLAQDLAANLMAGHGGG
ncbi:NRT2.5 [Symbiodinium necroappetens]|uniref:NRT2.5 protein n=1 Tax=Symbiodinium necroappetens TaxID=1628268 RepID=A0A812IMF8_9DINO|nr:NRT2.5 [Symbiodinium necroappetens]